MINTAGGCVAIYLRQDHSFIDISPDQDDVRVIEIKVRNLKIAVASYYAPAYAQLASILTDKLVQNYKNLVLTGDLNAMHQH